MGYADRDYFRETTRPPSRVTGAPVVKWLLISNLGLFLINILFEARMESWGAFSVAEGIEKWQLWQFISFQFVHADFGHVLFNSVGLYLFGTYVEQEFRSKGFLVFYLLCGIAGALTYALLVNAGYRSSGLVGASAGNFGVLVVAAFVGGTISLRLMIPPVTMTLRQLALIFLVLGAFMVLVEKDNLGGHVAHLGGAVAALIMFKTPVLRALLQTIGKTTVQHKPRQRALSKVQKKNRYEKKLKPKSKISKGEASEVDRILDKINEHGLQSLTEEERILLTKAGMK
jgi:membrane associated rhomboid family serine protease